MVAVKKDNPSKYYKILKEAQKQVRIGKRKKPKCIKTLLSFNTVFSPLLPNF